MSDAEPDVIPGLTRDRIQTWASKWGDDGIWKDVLHLSGIVWSAAPEGRLLPWHHLVLAVGNFKRQPGRRLRPAGVASREECPVGTESEIVVPTSRGFLTVGREDPETWRELSDRTPGAAVATTTTLLAALWPDYHFIFDWRVNAAANGLRIIADLPTPGIDDPDSTAPTSETFDHYEMVRDWLIATRDAEQVELCEVERALYQLSQRVPNSDHRTWRDYGLALEDLLEGRRGPEM